MTSKRRENINLVSFICFSFLVVIMTKNFLRRHISQTVISYCYIISLDLNPLTITKKVTGNLYSITNKFP